MASVNMLGKPHGILKFVELLIAIVCVALLRHYDLHFGGELNMASFRDRYLVGSITIGGMILVTAPLIVSYLFGSGDTSYRAPLESLYGIIFLILGLTAGSLAIEYYRAFAIYTPIVRAGISMGELVYNILGFALFLASGGLALDYYHNYKGSMPGNFDAGLSMGALLIINAFFYLLDAVLAFQNTYGTK